MEGQRAAEVDARAVVEARGPDGVFGTEEVADVDGGEGRARRWATDEEGRSRARRRIGRVGRREAEFAHEAGLESRRDGAEEVVDVLEPRKGRARDFCERGDLSGGGLGIL